jgi:hypothetical protein
VSKAHPLHRWLPEHGEPRIPCESTNVTSRKPSPIDVAAVPAAFIRSGKRASRTGPSWAMNEGMVLVAPSSKTASNCGFETGLDPPGASCAWELPKLFELYAGPSPELGSAGAVPVTESTDRKRLRPSSKVEYLSRSQSRERGSGQPTADPHPWIKRCRGGLSKHIVVGRKQE